jgi:ADP-ribose pyrophosphatase YjhB (NUDIX family)
MILQVGVKAFLRNKDGRFLLLKRSEEKYKNVSDCWDIVGGRIEPGSGLIENLKREIFEETKLELKSVPRLIYAQDIILKDKEKHIVRLSYVADIEGEPELDLSENVEYKWLSLKEIKDHDCLDKYVKEIVSGNMLA